MRAPVGHLAAGELIPPAKIPVAIMAVVIGLRRLAEPEVPIQFRRHRERGEGAFARAGGQRDNDVLEFAYPAIAHQLASEAEIVVAALLAADLKNGLMLLDGFDQALAFIDGQGEGLLTVYILAGFDRREVHQRMPMVRRAVDDAVNILALEEFAEILVASGRFLAFHRELLRSGFGVFVV